MPLPARNTLAVIGAGPIGLEAALAARDAGFDVHVFERGVIGDHIRAWGHVRLFTPWRMNLGPVSKAHLERGGWSGVDADKCPSGAEYVEKYLEPLGKLAALSGRIHRYSQVVHVSRQGMLKSDATGRREQPFRIMARDSGGRESYLHAFAVIDASGVYGQPNWAGDGGIPARGETYLAPQMSYHLDDVLGLRRDRYAGRKTLVIGAGASAMTLVANLAQLADEVPGTSVVWATRAEKSGIARGIPDDPLPERRALHERARALAGGSHAAVTHLGGIRVEGLEFNSATHRYRAQLFAGDHAHPVECDQILIACGYGPDNSIYRELRIHECYGSRAPMKLAAALDASGAADCLTTPAFGADVLENPEPDFYILGNKSYGRHSTFLLETGFKQVADVVSKLSAQLGAASATL
jgi:thioredoxin reductase